MGPERPGDPGCWNVPFGALLRSSDAGPDPLAACRSFFQRGLRALADG